MALRKKRVSTRPKTITPSASNGLHHYLALYIDYLQRRAFTEHTITSKVASLKRFIAWCDERGLQAPQHITRPILERYQRHLMDYRKDNGEPLSLNARAAYLLAVRSWFAYLAHDNHLPFNPAQHVEPPRTPKRLPRNVLTPEQIADVLRQPNCETPDGIRDRAIIETLYATGIRRYELIRLKLHHIDVQHGTVFIEEGKGRKDRYVPISDQALRWIKKYVEDVRYLLVLPPDDGTLFFTDYGEVFNDNSLQDMVTKYLRLAGIPRGACHLFRHAMATHMLENGADIRFIQAILGHTKLSTTALYTHVAMKKLKAIYDASHPAQLGIAGRAHANDETEDRDTPQNATSDLLTLFNDDDE